jgi:hypothetical protein
LAPWKYRRSEIKNKLESSPGFLDLSGCFDQTGLVKDTMLESDFYVVLIIATGMIIFQDLPPSSGTEQSK